MRHRWMVPKYPAGTAGGWPTGGANKEEHIVLTHDDDPQPIVTTFGPGMRIMEDTPLTLGDGLLRLAQEVVSDVAMAYGCDFEDIGIVILDVWTSLLTKHYTQLVATRHQWCENFVE